HSRTVRSAPPVASVWLSGENAAAKTLFVWPTRARSVWAAMSHSFTSPEVLKLLRAGQNSLPPADARYLPSGENATAHTQSLCRAGPGNSLPPGTSTSLAVPDHVPSARVLPFGANARPIAALRPAKSFSGLNLTAGSGAAFAIAWSAARDMHT